MSNDVRQAPRNILSKSLSTECIGDALDAWQEFVRFPNNHRLPRPHEAEMYQRVINYARSELAEIGLHNPPKGHVAVVTNGTLRTIPDDEPLFLLRGQDKLAPFAVEHWAGLALSKGLQPHMIDAAIRVKSAMILWKPQKMPDMPRPVESPAKQLARLAQEITTADRPPTAQQFDDLASLSRQILNGTSSD